MNLKIIVLMPFVGVWRLMHKTDMAKIIRRNRRSRCCKGRAPHLIRLLYRGRTQYRRFSYPIDVMPMVASWVVCALFP